MVQEEGARCLSVLSLPVLSRKRGVLVFVRNLEALQAPPGMPLPDSGELCESLFLTQFFFFFQEAEEILVQKWKRSPSAKLLILLPMETEESLPLCCDSALNFQVYFYAQIIGQSSGG